MNESTALTDALVTEHAAIYAYGVLGARLDEATRQAALAAYDAHRARRDLLESVLRSRKVPLPAVPATYDLTVGGRPAALALAIRVETEVGVRWRDLIAATENRALRRTAVGALQDSAVRATQWRRTAGVTPWTEPLPGHG